MMPNTLKDQLPKGLVYHTARLLDLDYQFVARVANGYYPRRTDTRQRAKKVLIFLHGYLEFETKMMRKIQKQTDNETYSS